MNATKRKCERCHGMVCHTGHGSALHRVFTPSRVGGPGRVTLMSTECLGRMKGAGCIVVEANAATV